MDIVTECRQYVEELFAGESSGHGMDHTLRVLRTALTINKEEQGDETLVSLIALLHDADDRKLFPEENGELVHAKRFLESRRVPAVTKNLILSSIKDISFKARDTKAPQSLEGRIVQDADRLDAMGCIGIARAFQYGGSHGRPLYDSEKPLTDMDDAVYRNRKGSTINHFYEKLFLLKDLMNTSAGKRLAEKRDRILHEFVDGFLREWNGEE